MSEPVNRSALNLLLVSDDDSWHEAVRAAAEALGGGFMVAHSGADAMRRLAMPGQDYSHLLLEPTAAGTFAEDLVGMTSGEEHARTGLVMLGRAGSAPPHVPLVTYPDESLAAALLAPPALPPSATRAIKIGADDLRAALAGAMIRTRYQPIVAIASRVPETVEVLARLDRPQQAVLGPDRFIPEIEDAGLAAQFTEHVVSRALADLGAPAIAGHGLLIALNFPLEVLLLPDAIAALDARRAAAGLAADRIILELTESRPVIDLAGLRRTLERLRAAGYRLSIDDVSPAVAHHRALLDLPFTSMKFDMRVVHRAETEPAAHDFIARIVAAAHERGLRVIAEGVQSQAIWDRMAMLGVDSAQGFLVGRPLPAAAIAYWLDHWS